MKSRSGKVRKSETSRSFFLVTFGVVINGITEIRDFRLSGFPAFRLLRLAVLAGILSGCHRTTEKETKQADLSLLSYAQGFSVRKEDNVTWLTVHYPYQGATSGYQYLLVPRGEEPPPHDPHTAVITVPVQSIVCTSTTHIPHLDYLGLTEKLIGFPSTDYVSSAAMRKRIDAGHVKELGVDSGMNLELLFTLHPGLVIGYTMSADLGQLGKIQELGIPVVINAEYLEKDPLGRAEWIKYTALFFNKEKEADSVFRQIEQEYKRTKELTSGTTTQPSVMSGIVYGDTWFTPGGQSYAARLLKDAGCNYLWSGDSTKGSLQLSFESVYQHAKDADLWIGAGSFNSLDELKAAEKRYALFKPFRAINVYTYNARMGAKGGNEFLELGTLRPDIIIKDLVKIAHPGLLPDYNLYFHKKLD